MKVNLRHLVISVGNSDLVVHDFSLPPSRVDMALWPLEMMTQDLWEYNNYYSAIK
jgi:hypothetical protein